MKKYKILKEEKIVKINELKDMIQFGATMAMFLPVIIQTFLLISKPEEANKMTIFYFIPVAIWIALYVGFYLYQSLFKKWIGIVQVLKTIILNFMIITAGWILLLGWIISLPPEQPLSAIKLALISGVFLGVTNSIFFLIPLSLVIVLTLGGISWEIYSKWKKKN